MNQQAKIPIRISRAHCAWLVANARQQTTKDKDGVERPTNSSLLPTGYIDCFLPHLVKVEGPLNLKFSPSVCYNEKLEARELTSEVHEERELTREMLEEREFTREKLEKRELTREMSSRDNLCARRRARVGARWREMARHK